MRAPVFALALLLAAPAFAQSTARYRVTFESTWSSQTHPLDYPGASAHYSPLVGATHATPGALWRAGGLATDGVEQMAETGATSILRMEVAAHVAAGEAGELVTGGALGTSPGMLDLEVELTPDHPLLTLVTMVAPSPDWFVGVDGLDLRDGAGWLTDQSVELHVWDAGTDSGPSYGSPNEDTQPREPIAISDAAPFASGNTQLGELRFELLSVVSDEGAPAAEALAVGDVWPYPATRAARLRIAAPEAVTAQIDLVDMLGRTVRSVERAVSAAGADVELPVSGLVPGSYSARVRVGDTVVVRRLTLVR